MALRPDWPPARPDDIAAQAGPTGGGSRVQPVPERCRARPRGCPALLAVASKDRKDGDCIRPLC
ncbi:MAG: hypothetical protein WCP70_07085 [Methanothrix sp.]